MRDEYDFHSERRAGLAALNATALVDDLAVAVLKAAPEGTLAVLARLGQALETRVVLPGVASETYATIYWLHGRLTAEISKPGSFETYGNVIEIKATLPETALAAAIDQPLRDVAALPFACEAPITQIEDGRDGWLRITLDLADWLLDASSGELRDRNPDGHGV